MEIKYKKDMQQLKFYRTLNNFAVQQRSHGDTEEMSPNQYSDKYFLKDKKGHFMKKKVSIPLSAEIQAQAEEITKEFNHVFMSQKNIQAKSRAESTIKPAPLVIRTAEEESRHSQNSPGTPIRLSTTMPPIRVGSVLGTTIIRTKSNLINDTKENSKERQEALQVTQNEVPPSTANMTNYKTSALYNY